MSIPAMPPVCGASDQSDPIRRGKFEACYHEAMAKVIKAVNRPLVTEEYITRFPHYAALDGLTAERGTFAAR